MNGKKIFTWRKIELIFLYVGTREATGGKDAGHCLYLLTSPSLWNMSTDYRAKNVISYSLIWIKVLEFKSKRVSWIYLNFPSQFLNLSRSAKHRSSQHRLFQPSHDQEQIQHLSELKTIVISFNGSPCGSIRSVASRYIWLVENRHIFLSFHSLI